MPDEVKWLPKFPVSVLVDSANEYGALRDADGAGLDADQLEEVARRANEWEGLKAERDGLRALLDDVLDMHDESCRYDHNDFCQSHYTIRPCLIERIDAALHPTQATQEEPKE